MNLEDLPRLESLSPIKDIIYHNLADQINLNRLEPQSSIAPMSSKNYLSKPYMLENNKSGNEPMLSGGLRYITQESEIVEVLWKQDVDLGYSLTSEQSSVNVPSSTSAKAANSDDIEKLKALEELKLDGTKYDTKNPINENDQLDDDWAGIPFTIDNETGEYIRLPLDEILNDVIQFAELAGETGEINESSNGASTSAAAAAIVNNQNSIKLKSERDVEQHSDELTGNNNNSVFKSTTTTTTTLKTIKSEVDVKKEKSIEVSQKDKKNNNNKTESEASTKNKGKVEQDGDDDDDDDDDDDLTQSEVDSLPSPLFDLDDEAKEELADLDMMLHSSAPFAPHHHPHPHAHHPHHHHHHHHHHRATGTTGSQNYGGVNSAFHRQPSSTGGFHHGHHQGRMPLSRGVSVEQRLQDIASLFNPMGVVGGVSEMSPYSHYPTHHYSYQSATQHAQYPPPPPPPPPHPHHHHHATVLHPNASLGELCSAQPHYGHNLGSAVSSSMHLTNSTHDADISGVGAVGGVSNVGAYKMEHDMLYYSNATSDMNHTTDGFINSILNDEDLHLMDMNVNVNDNFCRMVDVNNSTSNNSSVLGLSGGHASATGAGPVSSSGLSMSGNNVNAAPGGAATMTSELMVTGSGQTSGDRLDASSDSAVSSMGSERVSSLSDGEWGEGSDSAQDYHPGKYGGPYDYSYNSSTTNSRLHDGTRQPPVAQKKHHMFGKRFLNEQPPGSNVAAVATASSAANANAGVLHGPAQSIKYEYEPYPPAVAGLHQNMGNGIESGAIAPILTNKEHHSYGGGAYSLDFSLRPPRTPQELIQHNHTYTLPQGSGSIPRPQVRDKKSISSSTSIKSIKSTNSSGSGGEDDVYMTRDEKRARAMNIPIPVPDIINLPMDEFNERLSKYDLSENQLSLIRDIRRRGKNKVAAQNCRKRKLDQILSLEDEVKQVRRRKDELQQQRDRFLTEHKRVSNKFSALHRHIFQYLRDADGNPCSTSEYSLQQASDGSIYLLPRDTSSNNKNEALTNMNVNSGILSSTVSANNNNNNSILAPHQIQTSMSATNTHHQQQHTTQVTMAHNHLQQQQQQQQQHHIHPHHQTQQNQVTATGTVAQTQQSTQTTGNGISGAGGGGHYHQPQKD
ncbi:NFE2 like bZIP transcription factor cap-n-collar isoform 2-T9 [Glossina fuscipes fuscipes]